MAFVDPFPYEEFPIGRPYHKYEDYVKLGKDLNLTYLGVDKKGLEKRAPRSVRTRSYWKCDLCSTPEKPTIMYKTWRAVFKARKEGYPGCPCQSKSNTVDTYIQAGKILGWRFVGPRPRTNKDTTHWIDFYGHPIEASLVEITNNPQGKVRKKFKNYVNPRVLITGIPRKISEWKTE